MLAEVWGSFLMRILVVIIVLLVLLLATAGSSARSYFVEGRLAGMEQAMREIIRGVNSHYELAGQPPPDDVTKAVEAVKTFARAANYRKNIDRYQARLWISAMPSAPPAGARDMTPANSR